MQVARNKKNIAATLVALVASLAAQYPVGWLLYVEATTAGEHEPGRPPRLPLQARLVPQHRPPPKPEPKEPPDTIEGQIVELSRPPEPQKPPPDARFLSQYDTRTEREVKSRHRGRSTGRSGSNDIRDPSEVQSPESNSPDPTRLKETGEVVQVPESTSDLPVTSRGSLLSRSRPGRMLLPSNSLASELENLQALSAGHFSADDALLDIDEEDESTVLNSRKFRYWDFFNRVKERVRQQWRPDEVYRQRDPNGQVYGIRDRLTILHVTLDQNGNVSRLVTVRNSGAGFLDDEARRAFKAAGPFPNPPSGLLDDNGLVTFKFGFLFEISGSRYRFFWKQM